MAIILNPNLASEVEHSAEVHALVRDRAEKAADIARSIAPVVSGAYRDSIHVEEDGDGAKVVADATNEAGVSYAAWVEVGDAKTPAHHTLAKAGEMLGSV